MKAPCNESTIQSYSNLGPYDLKLGVLAVQPWGRFASLSEYLGYCNNPKYLDTLSTYYTCPKI